MADPPRIPAAPPPSAETFAEVEGPSRGPARPRGAARTRGRGDRARDRGRVLAVSRNPFRNRDRSRVYLSPQPVRRAARPVRRKPVDAPSRVRRRYALGRQLLRYSEKKVPDLPWDRLLHRDFWHAFTGPALRPRLLSFLVGTIVLATLIGLAAYVVVGAVLRIYHRRHPRVAERAARKKRRRREAREPRTEGL